MIEKWRIAIENTEYLSYYEIRLTFERLRMDEYFEEELYLVVAFNTGLNYRNISKLRWRDILHKEEFEWTRPMTKQKFHFKWVDADIKERIERIYRDLGEPDVDSFLFTGEEGVKPNATINNMLKRIRCRYALPIHRLTTRNIQISFARHLYETAENKSDMVAFIYAYIGGEVAHVATNFGFVPEEEIDNTYDMIQKKVFGKMNN